MKKKSLRQWIRNNRKKIDYIIKIVVPDCRINDDERRLWVLNDEGLFLWAKREHVDV
jgi:hypothetical protein